MLHFNEDQQLLKQLHGLFFTHRVTFSPSFSSQTHKQLMAQECDNLSHFRDLFLTLLKNASNSQSAVLVNSFQLPRQCRQWDTTWHPVGLSLYSSSNHFHAPSTWWLQSHIPQPQKEQSGEIAKCSSAQLSRKLCSNCRREEETEAWRRTHGKAEGRLALSPYDFPINSAFFFFNWLLFIWLRWVLAAACGICGLDYGLVLHVNS